MSLNSYLDLYLTLFGWHMYGEIWLILQKTGIAFLPFIGMIMRNTFEPLKSQETKDAATTSLRRVEIDMIAMLTVVVLAVQPTLPIGFTGINYARACPVKSAATAEKNKTTFMTTFKPKLASMGVGNVPIPIWWYGVMAISGGINNMIILRIPCETDMRLLKYQLNSSRIKSPRVRREAQKFFNDCYAPAMDDYVERSHYLVSKGLAGDVGNTNDIWLGSDLLTKEIYKHYRSKTKIHGFPYDPNRDLEYMKEVHIPVYGKPTCKEWWEDDLYGLRTKLRDQISTVSRASLFRSGFFGGTIEESDEAAIRMLIVNEQSSIRMLDNRNVYNDPGLGSLYGGVAGLAGVTLESATFMPKIYLIKMAAPMIQSILLMLIYMFLSLILLFASYRVGTVIFMSIVIFSIKFWTVLWAVAHWLDTHLIESLKPTTGNWYDGFFGDNLSSPGDVILSDTLIMLITGSMYIVMPLFWLGALGWVGYGISSSITRAVSDLSGSAATAGEKGGSAAYSKGKSVVNSVRKK